MLQISDVNCLDKILQRGDALKQMYFLEAIKSDIAELKELKAEGKFIEQRKLKNFE